MGDGANPQPSLGSEEDQEPAAALFRQLLSGQDEPAAASAALTSIFGDDAEVIRDGLKKAGAACCNGADSSAWLSCLSRMPPVERSYWVLQVGSLIAMRDRAALAAAA